MDSASAVHKQAEESCLLAGPMGSGQGTQEFVLGLRTPEAQNFMPVYSLLKKAGQSGMVQPLLLGHFLSPHFVPGIVL